jgi:DNA ligase (NAD+)
LFNSIKRKEILDNLSDLDGMGKTQVKSIENFFLDEKNLSVVKSLVSILQIKDFKGLNKKGKFSNKNLMFTGGFEKISRSEAKNLTENNGGKVLGAISKKLDILVVGDSKPTKKKIDKAKELKIKIINEKDWYKLLNI